MFQDSVSVSDIYNAGQRVVAYAEGLTQAELKADSMRTSAILYQILIIGEATKRLSREFRAANPAIPWDDMAGMRDFIAHQYDRIDFNVLWQSIQQSVPDLLVQLKPLLD